MSRRQRVDTSSDHVATITPSVLPRWRGGPPPVFCHARLVGDETVFDGERTWRGGTPVAHDEDGTLDGVFGGWDSDEAAGAVRVFVDRLGFFPLYYFASSTEFCVSPNLLTLLARGAPRELDDDALGVFLRTGWFLGDDTAFAAIRAVPPSVRFEWANGALHVEHRARPFHEIQITRAAAIDGYIDLFRESIARRLPDEPFTLPVSGGADSRHILLELVRQGRPPSMLVTATQGPHAAEVPTASRLSAHLDIPHAVVEAVMDAGWHEQLRKNGETNFCADEHAWYLPVADYLRGHTRVTYDGIAGDFLSANVDLQEKVVAGTRAGRVDELVDDALSDTHREDVLRQAVTPSFYRRIPKASARERLAEEARRHLGAANPYSSFHFDNYVRREITLNAHATLSALQVHTPFLDRDLVGFLTSLPQELLLGGRFHRETIETAYPDAAHLPFSKDLPVPKSRRAFTRVRRIPPHLVLHASTHLQRPRSCLLRAVPPVLIHPATSGSLGTFNQRGAWLRQLELLTTGDL